MSAKEKAKDIFNSVFETAAPIAREMVFNGALSIIAPGVISTMLAYKQKRQERMYEKFLLEIRDNILSLEAKLEKMNKPYLDTFKENYFGLVSDYVLEEVQEEKIKYMVNGFLSLASVDNAKEDFVLFYYDTLAQLRLIDIDILKYYYQGAPITYIKFMEDTGINYEQFNSIREKLVRIGLLSTRRDAKENDLYGNIEIIVKYLESLTKYIQGKDRNIKAKLNVKRLEKDGKYQISRFGKEFISFFDKFDEPGNSI